MIPQSNIPQQVASGHPEAGHYDFSVEPFSEDYSGRLSWRFLGNHILRCASLHAGSHGFGYQEMNATRHAWVLSRLVIELESMPRTGEAYAIETWISRVYRQFTDRLFEIKGADGHTYGHAFSIWALIDIDSRQPIDLSQLPAGDFTTLLNPGHGIPIKGPGRIRVRSTTPVRSLQTYYSDLDINGHVNSIRYIEMILDLFPKNVFDSSTPRRIEAAYCAESYCGETLHFFLDDNGDGNYAVEVRKESGECVVKCALTFQSNS